MKATIQSKTANSHSSATMLGAVLALGLSGVLLAVAVAPAAAGKFGMQGSSEVNRVPPPVVRDHRIPPTVHDHRAGVRDHRTAPKPRPSRGGVSVGEGRPRGVPCYGNLC